MQNVTKMSLSAGGVLLSLVASAGAGATDKEQDYDRDPGTSVRAPYVDARRGETWVDAPYARVYSGHDGTRVRAPFVDLFVPRDDRR